MSKKMIIKIIIDILMTAALPLLMCYSLVGEFAHEVIGVTKFVLFVAHHVLNFGWAKSLFKGKYTVQRTVNTLVNITIFACMLGLMYSGIVMSRHIFTFLHFGSAADARNIHMLCAYWGFLLMSLHLGMHVRVIIGAMKKAMKLKKSIAATVIVNVIFGIVSVIGIHYFFELKLMDYLFMRIGFVFFDFSVPVTVTILKYVTVMVLFAHIGYAISMLMKPRKHKEQ